MDNETIKVWPEPSIRVAPITNMHAYFRYFLKVPGVTGQDADGLLRWMTAMPVAWYNGILSSPPARRDDAGVVQNAIKDYQVQGKPEMSWWLAPEVESTGWDELLISQGFIYRDEDPGMAIDLTRLPVSPQPEGLRLARVNSASETRTWVETLFKGFGNPRNLMNTYSDLTVGMGFDRPMRNYLGYAGDQPVATSTLFLGAGTGGVYYVSTLEDFRGRGFGTALTLCALRDARELEYKVGVLQASKMGYPVYQEIGFETTCNHGYYFLKFAGSEPTK